MFHARVDALVIDVIAGGPDGVGTVRVPNGAASEFGPFLPPASALVEEANDLAQGSFAIDGDLLVLTATQGVLRFDLETKAFVGTHISPVVPSGALNAGAIAKETSPDTLSGEIFISDFQSNGGVYRFDGPTGAFVSEFVPAGLGGLSLPGGLMWKSFPGQGYDLLVVSTGSNAILRYDEDGSFIGTFASGGMLSTPRDITRYNQNVLVSSEGTDAILELDGETGALVRTLVAPGAGGLDAPSDLEIARDGSLYVRSGGTQQILRFDGETGAFLGVFAEAGSQGLTGVGGFALFTGAGDTFEGPRAYISGVTITNGASSPAGLTAGLNVDRGSSLRLSNSTVRDNVSSVTGGGIKNLGWLTLYEVEVMRNSLPRGFGGGQQSSGGGIHNEGDLTIERCLIADNEAVRGGGINANSGSLRISNSTIAGNQADGSGGGIRVVGGGALMSFSTVTGNTADMADGDAVREGGGIYVAKQLGLDVGNSIIADNFDAEATLGTGFSPDCFVPTGIEILSFGDNLIGAFDLPNCYITDFPFGDQRTIQSGTLSAPLDPELLGPGYYGGPTQSCPLESGSPAIDADTVPWTGTFYECRAIDQRGLPRPGGAACDIGSTELQIAPPEALWPADSAGACTGAGACTVETWGVDLNAGTGYLWNVDGGATGGPAELFLRVAVLDGNRAMGLHVNGAPVTVISTNATDSPRPAGKEFGPFPVTLNPGTNTVELVDDQGTAELDVQYLRVESSLGLCDNGVCSSKESCSTCLEDCGACGVTEQLLFSQSAEGCTGASNCTEESWGVDLNGDTGYRWTVSGGATGGGVSLFTKVAVLSGARAMGFVVNGTQLSVVSSDSSASPRPVGREFGPFFVTLAPGDNVIELVDSQGTAEFDVHYLRTELSSGGPCASFCTNPQIISWSGSYQGGSLGAGARCLEITQPVAGGNCGNFASGRSLFLNGTNMPCNTGNWASLPSAVNGGYCVRITPGSEVHAFVTLW